MFRLALLAAVLSVWPTWSVVSSAVEPLRPNIVVVLVDDMGFSDLGCYGSEIHEQVDAEAGFYATDAFTDRACQYVSEAVAKDDQPFFLYLAYNAPHWPLNAKPKDFAKYRGEYRDGWQALTRSRFAKQKSLGLWDDDVVPAPHVGPDWDSLSLQQRDDLDAIMAAYAGCIDSIDQNVGKLTRHLEQLGQLDNTLILFLSDNGACQEGGILGQGSEHMVMNPPAGTDGAPSCFSQEIRHVSVAQGQACQSRQIVALLDWLIVSGYTRQSHSGICGRLQPTLLKSQIRFGHPATEHLTVSTNNTAAAVRDLK